MLLWEWMAWQEGYDKRLDDEWQQTRALYTLLYNVNVDKKDQKKPSDLIKLRGDKVEKIVIKPIPGLDERMKIAAGYKGKRGIQVNATEFFKIMQ